MFSERGKKAKCKRHYVLIQEPVRYEIRRNGIWENKTTTFKVAKLLLFFDLVIGVKGLICRYAAKSQKKTKRDQAPRPFHGRGSNYGRRRKSALNRL